MSESVQAARTLVWCGSEGDADKTRRICDSMAWRNSTLVGGERSLWLQGFLGYQGWTLYMGILIPLARY